ncbi:hypothetical protein QC762_105220 [Podospora pseudocomata]|uniref:Alpha/beta hydrolase n=1 Tax=Podospora pseudocomata TaxID=2093779 RepID=A0ABR0GSY7_9PEZI|nr:hypothetical protein QC762_105220 [Podospora pseudocomata]
MKSLAPQFTEFFRFELLRILGTAPFHGCDVSEWAEATESIKQDDPESWYGAWTQAAERVEVMAEEAMKNGDHHAARWAFLRACNYRRASEFMLHVQPSDPRLLASLVKASDNFRQASKLLNSPVETLEIPFGNGSTLPGYLFLPAGGTRAGHREEKTPILVATGGFDSIQEELFFGMADGARVRGYACVTFEGPGQGVVARRGTDRLLLRPDWEVVIKAVLDHIFQLAVAKPHLNLDLSRIALVGASMGGYFALRGATDPRVSAVVSVDGFYDLGEMMASRTPRFLWPESLGDGIFNWLLGSAQRWYFQTRWEFQHAMLATGATTPAEVYRQLARYHLRGPEGGPSVLDRIKCPALITGSRDTLYWSLEESTYRIVRELTSLEEGKDKKVWIPTGWGQGSLQAKVGAFSHFHHNMFSWLDDVFGIGAE